VTRAAPLAFLAVIAVGCTVARPLHGTPMVETRLFCGLTTPDGGVVSDDAWRAFVAEVVTPRFPDGLTVLDAHGQYRAADGIHREETRVLLVVHRDDARAEAAIVEIVAEYRRRFRQDSVLRVDSRVGVEF
jgi:hypothetical protein